MYSPQIVLSDNTKCHKSINLPIIGHCRPTSICYQLCYAKTGRCAMSNSTRKQIWVSNYLAGEIDSSLARLKKECSLVQAVRLSGTGDINLKHIPNIIKLAESCPNTQFWGMTRKIEIARKLNKPKLQNLGVLVTVDASSPKSVWNYPGALCYGPRRARDVVPEDDRIKIVFPYHFRGTVLKGIPRHRKDCRAVWHEIDGCFACKRCQNWYKEEL